MSEPFRSLDRITIPTPCDADWDLMAGNDQVRFCEHCNLRVTNLSSMTRRDAMRLVARSNGRLCVRYVQKPDGGVLTRQIPEQLHRIGRRVSRIAAGAFSAALTVSSAAAQTRSDANTSAPRQVASTAELVSQPELGASLSGVIADPKGAVISGATLTLENAQSHVAFTYTTGDDGAYRFSFLEAGVYSLVVEAPTFARTELSQLILTARAERSENLTMDLPQVIAEVEVVSERVVEVSVNGGVAIATPQEPLVKAAFQYDLAAVRELAFTGVDINTRDAATDTDALTHAVENGNREMVQVLLRAGADVNARSRNGRTVLMHLRANATVEFVRDLIVAGAEINARDESGDTALIGAAMSCNLAVVKELMASGADARARNNDGGTALMSAAENEDPNVVALLLKADADVTLKNDDEETALTMAVRWGKADTVKALVEAHSEVNAKDSEGKTALIFAASKEDPLIAKVLIDAGADVNAKDKEGNTALMMAAEDGDPATVKALLDAGAEINSRDEDGWTSLMHANKEESVLVLLNAGADMTVKDKEGLTALGLARKADQTEIVKLLESRHAPE